MNDDRSEDDPIMDIWYSSWEQQCVEAIESEPDCESQLHNAKELYSQQMWMSFQTTASAIAQLYKGICLLLLRPRYDITDIIALSPSLYSSPSFPFFPFREYGIALPRSSDHDHAVSL